MCATGNSAHVRVSLQVKGRKCAKHRVLQVLWLESSPREGLCFCGYRAWSGKDAGKVRETAARVPFG